MSAVRVAAKAAFLSSISYRYNFNGQLEKVVLD